jgi:hypothetical protein
MTIRTRHYEVTFFDDAGLIADQHTITVDGRGLRDDRKPKHLIAWAQRHASRLMVQRFAISRIKLAHITATTFTPAVATLVYEEGKYAYHIPQKETIN